MPIELNCATAVVLPAHSRIAAVYTSMHLADAFAIALPAGASTDPKVLAQFILSQQPAWIARLTHVRDLIVASFGLKTVRQLAALAPDAKVERVGIFRVYSASETEMLVGEDDKHLDFRVSFLCARGPEPDMRTQLTISTVVHCHNLPGRLYLFVIAPFHRMVVKASLRRAALVGWPVHI